jgi:hypothetical protein
MNSYNSFENRSKQIYMPEMELANSYQERDIEREETRSLNQAATQNEEEAAPPHAVNIATRWNESKTTIWKVTATFWCMLVMGANDAAYGAIIPYVCLHFSLFFFP